MPTPPPTLQFKSNYIAGFTGDGVSTVTMALGATTAGTNNLGLVFNDTAGNPILQATSTNMYFGNNTLPLITSDATGVRTINSEYANISSIMASTLTVINVTEISTTVSTMTVEGKFTASGTAYYTKNATGANSEIVVLAQLSSETSRAVSSEDSISSALSTETSRASSSEGSLDVRATSDEKALSTEASRAISSEGSLDVRATSDEKALSTEVSRATSVEASLAATGSSGLSTETSRAISSEGSLDARATSDEAALSTEISRASSSEGSLDVRATSDEKALSTEASRATSSEGSLDARATSDEKALSTETSRAISSEGSLDARATSDEAALSTEASRASSSEGSLDVRATSDEKALSTEVSRATSVEASLAATGSSGLSTEISRASSSEGSLDVRAASDEAALSTEVSRATSSEASLDNRIDSFRSSVSSVFAGIGPIVGISTANLTAMNVRTGTVESFITLSMSDARKKKDIEEVVNALSTVDAMHPVYYNWIDHVNMNPAKKEIGFIAQEMEVVLPNVVNTADDKDGTKRVGYDRIVSLLVAAVKELKAEVSTLRG